MIVTAQLIRAFVFATPIVQSMFFFNKKIKLFSVFCSCTGQFVSDLMGTQIVVVVLDRAHCSSLEWGFAGFWWLV